MGSPFTLCSTLALLPFWSAILVTFLLGLLPAASGMELGLWYDKPAVNWEKEALPIGNGRLGAMIFGAVEKEQLQFNEDSLWIGDETDTGSYQAFGDLFIELGHGPASNFRRELDIARSVHTVSYISGGVKYRREYFASHPANVLVFRFSADKPAALSGTLTLSDAHRGVITATGNRLISKGNLAGFRHSLSRGNVPYAINLDYEAQVVVRNQGGTLETKDGKLTFANVDALTVFLDAGTDYVPERSQNWRGKHPHDAITARINKALATPVDELLRTHIQDYQTLFKRLAIQLGVTPENSRKLPTDQRLAAYRASISVEGTKGDPAPKGSPDPELEALLFQYARDLMISSSRPGDLPANLQGVWNNSNNPAWRCDYHSDVNIQMNYWFVDAANIGECLLPMADWLHSVIPVRREATQKEFGVRGWATRSENGIFGGATYHWVPGDAAWLAQNIWDHYAFSQDRRYLQTRAYPIIKELCEFWEDFLKEGPGCKLVSPASISPEHGPKAEGNSYEQQLVFDLFTNYIDASKALGVDAAFRAKVESLRSRLLGPQIGKWGQLQEWAEDRDSPKDSHRHTSHLIAVYPGRQISPLVAPELAKAAGVSLEARGETGDSRREWAWVWRCAIWARLGEAEKAYHQINGLFTYNLLPNLFGYHPPLQIDGDFGYAAGVCEMLVQSQVQDEEGNYIIHLLPALPSAWPEGSVKGLRARGGYTVDLEWKGGKIRHYRVTSPTPKRVKIRVGGELKMVTSEKANADF